MTTTNGEARDKLHRLIKDVRIAMMTTVEADGSLRSRPMWSEAPDDRGDLWFLTPIDSAKTREISREGKVNLAYSDPSAQVYVSVSGRAEIVRDRAAVDAHWKESMRTWFPKGKDDPQLALLKVTPDYGEYWDSPSGTMLHLYGYAKAALTGKPPTELTEDEKVRLR